MPAAAPEGVAPVPPWVALPTWGSGCATARRHCPWSAGSRRGVICRASIFNPVHYLNYTENWGPAGEQRLRWA